MEEQKPPDIEFALTAVEIFRETGGTFHLHSRVIDKHTLGEVLEELADQRFYLRVLYNCCIVGTGIYRSTDQGIVAEYEEGACRGLFDRNDSLLLSQPLDKEGEQERDR